MLIFSMMAEQRLRHVLLLLGPCSWASWAKMGNVWYTHLAGVWRNLYMGYVKCAVAIIPFAPPTPVRFNLSGAGGDLKTHSPASNIILNCGAIHSLRGLLLSLPTTFTVYMLTVQGVAYVQHWDSLRVASPTLSFTQARHKWKLNKTNWLRS